MTVKLLLLLSSDAFREEGRPLFSPHLHIHRSVSAHLHTALPPCNTCQNDAVYPLVIATLPNRFFGAILLGFCKTLVFFFVGDFLLAIF